MTSVRAHPKKSIALGAVLVGVALLFAVRSVPAELVKPTAETTPTVRVATIAELASGAPAITVTGEVRSLAQVELRAERSGKVTRVNVKAGQTVPAGTILAEIDNAQESAAVVQAQGTLDAAEATLAKVRGGARSEDRASASAQAAGAITQLASARESARSTYSVAFSASQDAVFSKADTFFTDPYTVRPNVRVRSGTYDERRALENERVALGDLLANWNVDATAPLSDQDIESALVESAARLERLKAFLDRLAFLVSTQDLTDDYTTSTKAADEAVMNAARAGIDGARQSIAGARQALAAAQSAAATASFSESKIAVGAQPEDVAAAQAAVTQARGVLLSARANLETTRIRTPIGGAVTTFNVSLGDFVSPQQSIAVVARSGAQEVIVFVSDSVRETLAPGTSVTIDGGYTGTVTSVASGLDPDTKLARVTVGVLGTANLTNGSFVSIMFATASTTKSLSPRSDLFVPITAIKVLPTGLVLLTVSDSDVLEAREIPEGTIVGDRMRVNGTLTDDLEIVTDVRGLIVGERVKVTRDE